MAAEDKNNAKILQEVWKREENAACADCGQPDPDLVSCTLGIFICCQCSEVHHKIPSINKVKLVRMNCWEESEVQFLAQRGNAAAKQTYEAHVPAYYYRPVYSDCRVLREQWIQAKYERKEFLEPRKKLLYSSVLKDGILWKRGRNNGQYLPRRFLLSEKEGCLKYFIKQDAKEPKIEVKIDTVNAMFQPEKMRHPNGLQITYLKDNKTRNIFVYHEDGKEYKGLKLFAAPNCPTEYTLAIANKYCLSMVATEIVDWFNAIRAVKFQHLKVAFPGASDQELKSRLTRNFLKEGYMEKTGPKQKESFKKRWFSLDHRRLMYFKDPLDAFAKGEVFLGSEDQGYTATKAVPQGLKGSFTWKYGIVIITPDRQYLFTCETEKDQEEWKAVFSHVMEQPMTPQEYAMKANFKLKH